MKVFGSKQKKPDTVSKFQYKAIKFNKMAIINTGDRYNLCGSRAKQLLDIFVARAKFFEKEVIKHDTPKSPLTDNEFRELQREYCAAVEMSVALALDFPTSDLPISVKRGIFSDQVTKLLHANEVSVSFTGNPNLYYQAITDNVYNNQIRITYDYSDFERIQFRQVIDDDSMHMEIDINGTNNLVEFVLYSSDGEGGVNDSHEFIEYNTQKDKYELVYEDEEPVDLTYAEFLNTILPKLKEIRNYQFGLFSKV